MPYYYTNKISKQKLKKLNKEKKKCISTYFGSFL